MKTAEELNAHFAQQEARQQMLAQRENTAKHYAKLLGHGERRTARISREDLKAMAMIAGFLLLVVFAALWAAGCGNVAAQKAPDPHPNWNSHGFKLVERGKTGVYDLIDAVTDEKALDAGKWECPHGYVVKQGPIAAVSIDSAEAVRATPGDLELEGGGEGLYCEKKP